MAYDAMGNYTGPDDVPVTAKPPVKSTRTTGAAAPASPVSIQISQAQDSLNGKPTLVFPSKLAMTRKYFSLTFGDYKREDIDAPSQVLVTDTIALPIPSNLNEFVKTQWDDVALGTFLGGASDSMASFVKETAKDFSVNNAITNAGTVFKDIAGKVKGDSGLSYALLRRGISALSEDAAVIADQSMGVTGNPHMSLAFRGVPLRSHTFTWKLAPETEEETNTLRQIIAMLKGRSLPQKVGDFLLSYPDMCQPRIYVDKLFESQLFMMKRCIVQDVRVNYAGGGVPSFFTSGGPTVVDLSITLKELSIVTRKDYAAEYSSAGGQ
jgi:hypothetical protein